MRPGELQTFQMTSMPAGVVPTEDGRLVAALDDGLYVVDPDARIVDRLSPYPDELGARANDACADLSGNIITGTLNLAPVGGFVMAVLPDPRLASARSGHRQHQRAHRVRRRRSSPDS